MDKVLEALESLVAFQDKESYEIIKKELKQKIELDKIQDELGIDLTLFFKIMKTETLCWKDRYRKLTHNISSEFISVKPYWSIGAGIMFEFSWNDRNIYAYEDCDVIIKENESPIGMPHIYLFLRGSDYSKTWALTEKELK